MPNTNPRVVRNYELQAQLNAVKRALAIAKEASESEESIAGLQALVAQLENGRSSNCSGNKCYQKMIAKEDTRCIKETELLNSIHANDKRRDDLLREVRREKMEAIAEMGEKNATRTIASDQRVREMEKRRAHRLKELSLKRFKRLEEIEIKKAEIRKENIEGRTQQHSDRERKLERIEQQQLEKEERLEAELQERERQLQERKERAENERVAKAEASEKQRKEVSRRCDVITDAGVRQQALQSVIDTREKRIASFKAQKSDEIRQKSRDHDEKHMKMEQKADQDLINKIRTIKDLEKKRTQREKRVNNARQQQKDDHEVKVRQKRLQREKKLSEARDRISETSKGMPPHLRSIEQYAPRL